MVKMFKSIFRGCTCTQCQSSRTKKDKQLVHKWFRRTDKQRIFKEEYEIIRPPGIMLDIC